MFLLLNTLIATLLSWVLVKVSLPHLNEWLLDSPNKRSSHKVPTPRGGGLSFVIIGIIFSFFNQYWIPLLCLPLAIIGFVDDLFNLPRWSRYIIQLITITILISNTNLPINETIQNNIYLSLLINILLIIVGTSIINFINFMDGLDGLVVGSMMICFAMAAFLINPGIFPFLGSLIGFSLWNWEPAKVHMGDVGSTFIGGVFAGTIFYSSSWNQALALLLIGTPLLGDAFFLLVRRLILGQDIFQAHKLHLFQRLHQVGWSHSKVSTIYMLGSILLVVAYIIQGWELVFTAAIIELLYGLWLDQKVAKRFDCY